LLTGLTNPPAYFPKNVLMNIKGYESLDTIMDRGNIPLSPDAFEAAANETRALVLDTRDAETFSKGFVPNSINIGIEGNFAMWVGEMVADIKQPILLVTETGKEEEAIIRLSRVGL
jgi:hydroxyacylglutathione hydrolase